MNRAGEYRHRVDIEHVTSRTADTDGGWTDTYSALFVAVPCGIEPATPEDIEQQVANTVQASISHLVKMRYLPGVTTQQRLKMLGSSPTRYLYVRGVQNVREMNRKLLLSCEETPV